MRSTSARLAFETFLNGLKTRLANNGKLERLM